MIVELKPEEYYRIAPLLEDEKEVLAVRAVMEGKFRGRIYADNRENPRTALIWAIYSMYYLVGDDQNPDFNDSFDCFLEQQLAPTNLELGATWFIVTLYSDTRWQHIQESLFKGHEVEHSHRWSFTFDPERYRALPDWKSTVPAGYQVERITRHLLNRPGNREIISEACETWPSLDIFFDEGIGYCVTRGGQVISTCVSFYMLDHQHEISINTIPEEERRKGLATLAARAYIDECLRNGWMPDWDADEDNRGSIALAEKLGFEKRRLCRVYAFPFKRIIE